jgi:serine/threonine protein kinase
VLAPDVAADPARLRRFEQEAQAASALNHPNIATIYGFDAQDGTAFIAMEYVPGRTLGARSRAAAWTRARHSAAPCRSRRRWRMHTATASS